MREIAKLFGSLLLIASVNLGLPAKADTSSPADAPTLSAAGPHRAGFRTVNLAGVADLASGTSNRILPLAVWYPTLAQRGKLACYRIPMQSAGGSIPVGLPKEMGDCGNAIEQAAPLAGQQLPVVVLSHGLNGWATGWSTLGENLASKGYVVIAIDHRDRDGIEEGGIGRSFGESILRRPVDQRTVLKALADKSASLPSWLQSMARGEQVALIGYSMGAYGALVTAGAGITPGGALTGIMPAPAIAPLLSGNSAYEASRPTNLKALVLLAPFGGALPLRAWTPESLAAIKTDTLFISGDQDDVVNHAGGVRWLFGNLSGANRDLLTYQNARHNIAMNPTPSQVRHLFVYRERFDEPVWRSDRLQAINAHMITAFFDKTLGANGVGEANLAVPVKRAIDGQWPLGPGVSVGASVANLKDQPAHWPGFQRRWAVGLEFERLQAAN
jgi:alpha-beta hydrolase superfamily lysophospholipase